VQFFKNMKHLKWFLTYYIMILIPAFWICWKVKHKNRPEAVLARTIYLINKNKIQ
jgi:hypothetical protein